MDRLVEVQGDYGVVTYSYDSVGNRSSQNSLIYTYNDMNELVSMSDGTQFTYDGDGKRIQKTEWIDSLQDYQTIIYVHSGLSVIYEKNTDTGQEATYVYGPAGRIAKKVSGLTDYYHTDHLGSTRLLTDESGTVITDVMNSNFVLPMKLIYSLVHPFLNL